MNSNREGCYNEFGTPNIELRVGVALMFTSLVLSKPNTISFTVKSAQISSVPLAARQTPELVAPPLDSDISQWAKKTYKKDLYSRSLGHSVSIPIYNRGI